MSNPTDTQRAEQAPTSPWWAAALTVEERTTLRAGDRPAWLDAVDDALAAAPLVGPVPADTATTEPTEPELLLPLRPFVEIARTRFTASVPVEVDATVADLHAVWACVARRLGRQPASTAARTLVAAMHADRDAHRLIGVDPRSRFLDFLRRVGGRSTVTTLLTTHPVLARLLGQACLQTVEATVELLTRLAADRAALTAVDGLLAGVTGPLTAVELSAGDQHAGRSVALLTFADGRRLVYKPRPLGLAARFDDLVAWTAEHAPDLAPGRAPVLDRGDYGWMGFVPAAPCSSPAAVSRFYRRQGALLALLYVLDATDVHFENLIAAGEHPVVVDVETLLHPGFVPRTTAGDDPAMAALTASVARTAMLPLLLLGEHGDLDVSGMSGEPGGFYPTPAPRWVDVGTDRMALRPIRVPFTGGANRPVLDGTPVGPERHRVAVLDGFRTAYELLRTHADRLVARGGLIDRFGGERIRVVVRDTAVYDLLLAESTEPAALRSMADRYAAFTALSAPTDFAHLRDLVEHELADLLAGDVPVFTAGTDGRDLCSSRGVTLPDMLAHSGMDVVRAKAAGLDAVDRRDQEWLITASLATRAHDVLPPTTPTSRGDRGRLATVSTRGSLLAAARGIGDELVARGLRNDTRVNWLGMELVDGRFWSVLPMGAGLAEGYCGTALFLAELGALTGAARYTDAARRAVVGLPGLLHSVVDHPELARAVGSGGYHGLGGIAYAVSRLARLLPDDPIGACLPTAVTAVRLADVAGRVGVADGTAGAVAALLTVHAEHAVAGAAEHAVDLARRLVDTADGADGAGFAAGRAGVDWALRRVAAASPTIHPPGHGHGPRGAATDTDTGTASDLGWCTGAGGVVAAAVDPHATAHGCAVASRGPRPDTLVDDYLDAVAGRTDPARDHALRHGDSGVVETLTVLAATGAPAAAARLAHCAATLIGAIDRTGPRCGTPHHVPSPGLLDGTAGIGLALLRAGFADQVPSTLLLSPG